MHAVLLILKSLSAEKGKLKETHNKSSDGAKIKRCATLKASTGIWWNERYIKEY